MTRRLVALAHGGAENDVAHKDGPTRAAEAALRAMREGARALDAVVEAIRLLEDDPRFNAGHGANVRLDGESVHMDAALMDGTGQVASVIGLDDVANPILVARDLLSTPNRVLAGPAASRFARRMGHAPFDPRTADARERLEDVVRRLDGGDPTLPATRQDLERGWNYPGPLVPSSRHRGRAASARAADTVGAVAFDGETFAAAGSTGGLMAVLDGRVSDVALPGCGLDASEHGAVAVSGSGDDIIRARLASRVVRLLEAGASPERAARDALAWLPQGRALALIVVGRDGWAALGRGDFPFGRSEGARS